MVGSARPSERELDILGMLPQSLMSHVQGGFIFVDFGSATDIFVGNDLIPTSNDLTSHNFTRFSKYLCWQG